MKRRVVLSPTAKLKLESILLYLEDEWSSKVKREFISKLDKTLDRIAHYPKSSPESIELRGLYKCVVTKHNVLFYRLSSNEIEIVTLFDTRQNPSKLTRSK